MEVRMYSVCKLFLKDHLKISASKEAEFVSVKLVEGN